MVFLSGAQIWFATVPDVADWNLLKLNITGCLWQPFLYRDFAGNMRMGFIAFDLDISAGKIKNRLNVRV